MLYFPNVQSHLDDNLQDWFAGGPSPKGWTRDGPAYSPRLAKIVGYHVEWLHVDEVLAKNISEVTRWHVDFLYQYCQNKKFDWRTTRYYNEYLLPRFNDLQAHKIAQRFVDLFEDIKENNVRYSICVADIQEMMLGFRYFRFDGCHRTSCAKILGNNHVKCFVFTVSTSLP